MLKIAVIMNNYFHDLATALLITSAVTVYYFAKTAEGSEDPAVVRYFIETYRRLTILGRGAFAWIILAGIVRIINFKAFEWSDAMGKNLIPALIVKHIMLFSAVFGGIYFWRKLNRKVNALKQAYRVQEAKEEAAFITSP